MNLNLNINTWGNQILQGGFNPNSLPNLLFQGQSLSTTQIISKIGTQTRPVQQGRAYLFDGTNDYVVIPNSTNYNRGSGTIVYKISFNTTQSGGANTYSIFDKRESSGDWTGINIGQLQNGTGAMRAQIFTGSGVDNVAVTDTVGGWADGENHEVVVTVSPTTVTIEVDGTGTNSVSLGAGVTDNTARPTLGATSPDNGSSYINWNGKIWGAEILVDGVSQGLWKCDEQAGTVSYDSSGNENHGAITNATLSTFHSTQTAYSYQNQVGYNQNLIRTKISVNAWGTYLRSDYFGVAGTDFELSNIVASAGAGNRFFWGASDVVSPIAHYTDIPYAVGSNAGTFTVFESGTGVYSSGTVKVGDKITMKKTGTVMTFYLNGVLKYTSSTPVSQLVQYKLDSAIFDSGTVVNPIVLNNTYLTMTTVSSDFSSKALFIPRDESDTTKDISNVSLVQTGKAKLNANLEASSCILLNGTNQYGNCPAGLNMNLSGNTLRIRGYFSYTALNRILVGKGGSTGGWAINVNASNQIAVFTKQNASGVNYRTVTGSTTLSTSTTYYCDITFTKDVTTILLGTNPNNLVAETLTDSGASGTYGDSAQNVTIGARDEGGSLFWGGKIWGMEMFRNGVIQSNAPIAEGAGATSYDISGNARHITWVNAPTWTTQDVFHYNLTSGFTPYYTVDDTLITPSINLTDVSFTYNAQSEGSSAIPFVNVDNANLIFVVQAGSTSTAIGINVGSPVFVVDGVTFSGNRGELFDLLDDNDDHEIVISNITFTGELSYGGWLNFNMTTQRVSNLRLNGVLYTGNTLIPAIGAVDAVGSPLSNPAVIGGHNDAETKIDFKNITVGGATPPELAHLASSTNFTAFGFGADTGWDSYDYAFYREKDSVANDRFLIYAQNLTGTDLEKAEKYTNN